MFLFDSSLMNPPFLSNYLYKCSLSKMHFLPSKAHPNRKPNATARFSRVSIEAKMQLFGL
jgi:hypothetical protein